MSWLDYGKERERVRSSWAYERGPRKVTHDLVLGLVFLAICWLGVTGTAWTIRNPMGNSITFWTHFPEAVRFKALPQFQEPTP